MIKRLEIPFIKSRGFECGQACAAMIIKHYLPDFDPNFDEINKIIHHKKDTYAFPPQLAILIDYFGIKSKVFSSDNINRSDEDPDQFKRWYGKDFEIEMKNIDLNNFDWMVDEFRKKKMFVLKNTKFEELLRNFEDGYVVCLPIDWNTLINKYGPYEGHFVIISGIENKSVLIHDPDTGPYQRYSIEQLKRSWNHPAIANDFVVAYGKSNLSFA